MGSMYHLLTPSRPRDRGIGGPPSLNQEIPMPNPVAVFDTTEGTFKAELFVDKMLAGLQAVKDF